MSALTPEMRQKIEAHLPNYPNRQAATLPALHIVQDETRHVSLESIREIAEILKLSPAEIHDTMSFYGFFRTEKDPLGKHRVWVCRSISCMLRGGEELLAAFCRKLGIHPGETTADGKITLEFAECLGVCEGAPCVLIDDNIRANVTEEGADKLIAELRS
jgi:NADH-quinone oxidoreductase subunit E